MSGKIYTDILIDKGMFYWNENVVKKKTTRELLKLIEEITSKQIPWANPPKQLKEDRWYEELGARAKKICGDYVKKTAQKSAMMRPVEFKIKSVKEIHNSIKNNIFPKLCDLPKELLVEIFTYAADNSVFKLISLARINRLSLNLVTEMLKKKDGATSSLGEYTTSLSNGIKYLTEKDKSLATYTNGWMPFFNSIDLKSTLENIRGSIQSKNLRTFLIKAVEDNDVDSLRLLLATGIDSNTVNETGKPALHIAVSKSFVIVKVLLHSKAEPNMTDRTGATAIFYANSRDIIALLKHFGAKLNFRKNDTGQTALHMAVKDGLVEKIQTLLDGEADPSIKDKDGKTPLDLSKDKEIKRIFLFYQGLSD